MQNDKLEKLKAQRKELDARIRKEQSRKSATQRKQDTRRKILAGAAVLSEAENNQEYKAALWKLLDRFLVRNTDREVFELPLKEDDKTGKSTLDNKE